MKEKPLTEFMGRAKKKEEKPAEPKVSGLKGPWELPEDWRWVALKDIIEEVLGGGTPPTSKREYWNGTIPWVSPKDMKQFYICDSQKHITPKAIEESSTKLVPKNSILVVFRSSILLKKLPVAINKVPVTINQDLKAFIPSSKIYPSFLALYLLSQEQYILEHCRKKGVTVQSLEYKKFMNLLVPLPFKDGEPDFDMQKRIVAKLDEVSRRLEEARRLAREAREEAEKLMASALHEVFSKAEERGWEWVKIKGIATDTERVNPTKTPDLEFWYIDIASVNNSTYQISKPTRLKGKEAPSRARKLIKAGDVIFATTRPYLKNVAIVPEWLNNQVCSTGFAVLRAIPEKTIPKWIFYYLISDFAIEGIKPLMRGANYPAITDRDLFNFKIPLPPLEEQKRIVAYLDRISERAQKLVKLYEEREKELEQLFPAILDRAFRGEV